MKDVSDSRSNVVYEGKDVMQEKEHVSDYGATCATTLRLTESYHGTGRIVVADSWFGSVKTAIALKKSGLYSAMVVKTAHKRYPREHLNAHQLAMGEWVAYKATLDDVELQAICFQDLKKKQFISTCSTTLPDKPRKTKHHGDVKRPKLAELYLIYAASIDIHNAVRTGSLGLEDVLLTKSPHMRQIIGILGFLFTNAYLAYRYFKPNQDKLDHLKFKMALGKQMVQFKDHASVNASRSLRPIANDERPMVASTHAVVKLAYPTPCYYCRHGYEKSERNMTTFGCSLCKKPLHKSSYKKRDCWNLHILHGIPDWRRQEK